VEVAAISVDSPFSHRAWAAELQIPFPLLSDFARQFISDYGVPRRDLHLLPGAASRSAFIVDAGGIIRYVWYQDDPSRLPPVDEILKTAGSFKDSR
jgi:peroxiredoxin